MTKMFGNFTSSEGIQKSGDSLGGGGAVESGAYEGIVKLAYAGQSQGGAQNITLIIDAGGREVRETIYVTNKKGENFYTDKNDATKRHFLPGWTTIDNLCALITGYGLAEQDLEDKVVEIYDFDARANVPTNVPVITAILGKPIIAGVLKEVVDKTQKQGDEYVPTGETREQNVFDKFFHPETKMTVSEYENGIEEATFYPKWVEKNNGKTRNKAKGVQGNSGAPGGRATKPSQPGAGAQPPKSGLFGGK